MSNKKPLTGLIAAVILCIISFLVYKFLVETKDYFLLDNPTEAPITVVFNEKKYVLGPGQIKNVSVQKGKNSISSMSEDGRVLLKDTFINIVKLNRGVINPTHSTYYTFRRYYGHIKNIDSLYKAHTITIDGKQYVGEVKEYNDLLIQDFYFNIDQNFHKIVNKVDTMESRVKIFRKDQFLEFYQKSFE